MPLTSSPTYMTIRPPKTTNDRMYPPVLPQVTLCPPPVLPRATPCYPKLHNMYDAP